MKPKSKQSAKDIILPHSQHKLDLYKNYLQAYLAVLLNSRPIISIHLYDLFCGRGNYRDGNVGSPVITNNCVKEAIESAVARGNPRKPISISVNDKSPKNIASVQAILEQNKIEGVNYSFSNEDAGTKIKSIAGEISARTAMEKSLVFIDPYGYSQISKADILSLIQKENSEVILFLPVSNIYRSYITALTDNEEKACYEGLRKFIYSLFPAGHRIFDGEIENNLELIQEIKSALAATTNLFVCSQNIERQRGMYYAIFFITANMLGFEKMIDSKWKVDPTEGAGHRHQKTTSQISMFGEQFQEQDKYMQMERLKGILLSRIKEKSSLTNNEVYELTLRNEFKASQGVKCLNELIRGGRIEPEVTEVAPSGITGEKHINYRNWHERKVNAVFKYKK